MNGSTIEVATTLGPIGAKGPVGPAGPPVFYFPPPWMSPAWFGPRHPYNQRKARKLARSRGVHPANPKRRRRTFAA